MFLSFEDDCIFGWKQQNIFIFGLRSSLSVYVGSNFYIVTVRIMFRIFACFVSPCTNDYHRLTKLIVFFQNLDLHTDGEDYCWKELFIYELCWYFVFNEKQHIFNDLFLKLKNKHAPQTQIKDLNIFYLWDLLSRSDKKKFFEVYTITKRFQLMWFLSCLNKQRSYSRLDDNLSYFAKFHNL